MTQQNIPKCCPRCGSFQRRVYLKACSHYDPRPDPWHREPAVPPEGETDARAQKAAKMGPSQEALSQGVMADQESKVAGKSSNCEVERAVTSLAQRKIHSAVIETCDTVRAQGFFSQETRDLLLQYSEDLYLMGLRDAGKTDVVASPAMTEWEASAERAELIDSNAHLRGEVERLKVEVIAQDCDVCGAELPAEKWRQCAACAEKAEAELTRLRGHLQIIHEIAQNWDEVGPSIEESFGNIHKEARAAFESTPQPARFGYLEPDDETPQGGQEGKP